MVGCLDRSDLGLLLRYTLGEEGTIIGRIVVSTDKALRTPDTHSYSTFWSF